MARATHFEYHETYISTTHYCQPSVGANLKSTTDRAQVTCKHCLAKMRVKTLQEAVCTT